QDAREIAAAEEGGGPEAAGVPQQEHERRTRPARWWRTDAGDGPGARHDLPGLDGAERGEAGPVLVTDRDEEERVLDGRQILAGQELGALRPDPLHVLQRGGQADGRRRRGAGLP